MHTPERQPGPAKEPRAFASRPLSHLVLCLDGDLTLRRELQLDVAELLGKLIIVGIDVRIAAAWGSSRALTALVRLLL